MTESEYVKLHTDISYTTRKSRRFTEVVKLPNISSLLLVQWFMSINHRHIVNWGPQWSNG